MDVFSKIPFNSPKKYSNFAEDMYGVNVKVPVHSYRSLYSKQPIYYTDYGSGGNPYPVYGRRGWRSPVYAKPQGGGIWAVDGEANSAPSSSAPSVAMEETNPSSPTPNTPASASAKEEPILRMPASFALTALGGVVGLFIASATKKDRLTGTLLGIAIVSGGQAVINTFTK